MKNRSIIVVVSLILLSIFIIAYFASSRKTIQPLEHIYAESFHDRYYIDGSYVVFVEEITVKNNTSNNLYFSMKADYPDDRGLILETSVMAYEKKSMKEKHFSIKANKTKSYTVYFKGKKGEKEQKANKMSPKAIEFIDLQ